MERQQALTALTELKLSGADEALEGAMDQLLAGKMPVEMQLDLLEAVQARNVPKLKKQTGRLRSHSIQRRSID